MSDAERREAAALMRVNHAGEVAAQALYRRLGIGREIYRYHYRRARVARGAA